MAVKAKHEVLQEFAAKLLQLDPMHLGSDQPLEYEAEALSILSRFTEAALYIPEDVESALIVATGIVKQTFDFWFDELSVVDHQMIATELLQLFRASYPQFNDDKTENKVAVEEVTIG